MKQTKESFLFSLSLARIPSLLLLLLFVSSAFSVHHLIALDDSDYVKQTIEGLIAASKQIMDTSDEGQANRRKIEAALNWNAISEKCLGRDLWEKKKATPFPTLLREVVTKTAFSRIAKLWKEVRKFEIKSVTLTGTHAIVKARFVAKQTFAITYYFGKKDGHWLIDDIAYDDLLYSENISEQINGFLKSHSFSQLLAKMKKRLHELDSEA